jgi:hypothetical protein
MSKLRPTLTDSTDSYSPSGAQAYFILLQAVESQPGLIHGKLDGPRGPIVHWVAIGPAQNLGNPESPG